MNKQKVAIIIPYFGSGGAEKMVSQLAAGMDQTCFQTQVFCIYGEPLNNHLELAVRNQGIPIHFIGKKRGFSPSAMVRLFRELDAFAPDLVHTHLYACLYAFPWPLIRRKPFLHTFHAAPELENRRFLRRVLSKLLIGGNVMIPVAISPYNQKLLSEYYHLPESRICTVFNPVDLSKYRNRQAYTNENVTFITAGRLVPLKNQKMMLRAFASFLKKGHEAELVILGKGEEEDALKALAQELGIQSRVNFAGFVVDVERYLMAADVFLLSSDYEALPLALLEAMAAGLPIVATDVGGVRDIVTDNGILIRSGDEEAMVRAMEELYKNRDAREKMAEASRRNVLAYDVTNTVAGYAKLYSAAAGRETAD